MRPEGELASVRLIGTHRVERDALRAASAPAVLAENLDMRLADWIVELDGGRI